MGPTLGNEYGRSLPLEDGQATATGNTYRKFGGEVGTCGFKDMRSDKQLHR